VTAPAADRPARAPAQPRGEQRVAALLDAAAAVVAEVGAGRASVHEIARRAGASMGSLYHFFPSKEALLGALAARYVEELRALTEALRRRPAAEWARLAADDVARELVGPYGAFLARHPAYVALAAATPAGRVPADPDFEARGFRLLEEVLAARWPRTPAGHRALVARTVYAMAEGVLAEVARADPAAGRAVFAEFTSAVGAYLAAHDVRNGRPPR
jgi:AcrR family transcriptional regulator